MSEAEHSLLPDAFFLETDNGKRFCLYYPARTPLVRAPLLFLHPFAEELNTTRRIVAQQARAFSQAGHPVLQIDFHGCGDSEGSFDQATWTSWCKDAHTACTWLREQTGTQPWLWGMRAGALLACQLAAENAEPARLLLWQPVTSGAQVLQQFLRLASAGQWIEPRKTFATHPAHALEQGQAVDVAGYRLSPQLAAELSKVRLGPTQSQPPGQLIWLEVSGNGEPQLSPAAARQLEQWRAAGWEAYGQSVTGPSFWQTVGLDDAPHLINATLYALGHAMPSQRA